MSRTSPEVHARYRNKHREKLRAKGRLRSKEQRKRERDKAYNPIQDRKNRLKRLYNLSLEEFDILLKEQDGKCKGCSEELKDLGNRHVDHCHRTGQVRGILCRNCNLGLGLLKENVQTLLNLIGYINDAA